jgi:2-polyprenyl-3-methyl-5-hydroxy-6-metoxy-1,4-benzoquinol methylase
MNRDELQAKVDELGPWHYCHQLQHGVVTGTSNPDTLPEKMDFFFRVNAFDRPVYPRVLDLGANSGIISMWFADNKHSTVDAIELGPKYYPQLELAVEQKGYAGKVVPKYEDIRLCEFGKSEYDLVLFLGTMHHIGEEFRVKILQACMEALLPSGQIVVQTKTELPVLEMLDQVGFLFAEKLFDMPGYERSAWKAQKDAMKP